MQRPLLIALLLTSMTSLLHADMYTGKVIDRITTEGLEGAKLTDEIGQEVATNEQGIFEIESTSKRVIVQLPGYDSISYKLQSKENLIRLEVSSTYQISTVKVEAKADVKKVVVSKQELTQEAIKKTTSTIFSDVIQVVKKLPGVSSRNANAQLYVRGGNSDEVIFSLDNAIVFNPYVLGGLVSMFNPSFVKTIDFYAGGFTAQWPQVMSAVLDVKNKDGDSKKFTGFADLSLTTADIFLEGPFWGPEDSSFMFGLRRTSYDLLVNLFLEGNLAVPYFYDGQTKLSFPLDNGSLSVKSLYSFEGVDIKFEFDDDDDDSTPMAEAKIIAQNLKLNFTVVHDWEFNDRIDVNTVADIYYTDGTYDIGVTSNTIKANVEQRLFQFRHTWQMLLGDQHILKTGLFLFPIQGSTTSDIVRKIPTTNNNYFTEEISVRKDAAWELFNGAFVQDDYEIIQDQLFINAGINVQYYSLSDQWMLNPRLSAKVMLQPNWDIHAATGLYSQYPIDVDLITNLIDEGPKIWAEESIHYIMGTKIELGKDYFIQAEGYYKDYRQLIIEDPNPELGFTNKGIGHAYGFDVIFQKQLGDDWDGWLTYSYIISERKITERGDPDNFGVPSNSYLEPVDSWYAVDYETKHVLNFVLNYSLTEDWKLALTQKIITGTPYTPVVGATYQPSIDEYVPIYGRYNSLRVPDSYSTDIKLFMPFFGLEGWSSYVQVTNLFDIKNINRYRYSDDYSERIEINELPRIIIAGIRWEF